MDFIVIAVAVTAAPRLKAKPQIEQYRLDTETLLFAQKYIDMTMIIKLEAANINKLTTIAHTGQKAVGHSADIVLSIFKQMNIKLIINSHLK